MTLEEARKQALANIDRLHSLRVRSRLALALFVVVSLVALFHFALPGFADRLRALLGAPPPTWLISLALVIYGFSALILTLGRLAQSEASFHGWSHLGYLSAFYFFYYYGGELSRNFLGVFTAGLTILILENYRISTYCEEGVKKEKEALSRIERGLHPPRSGE